MKLSKIGNKGVTLGDLSGIAVMFVLIGVTLGVGAYINSQIQSTAGWASTTAEYQAVGNATEGIRKLSSWLPIIAIVIAAGLVIATLVGAFSPRSSGV